MEYFVHFILLHEHRFKKTGDYWGVTKDGGLLDAYPNSPERAKSKGFRGQIITSEALVSIFSY